MKFQKLLMTGCRDMDKKTSKIPQKWGFSPICDPPRFFFKNRALSFLYPYGALTACKKLEKNNERTLRYLKTDGRTDGPTDGRTDQRTDGQGRLLKTPSGEPGVQNIFSTQYNRLVIVFVQSMRNHKIAEGQLYHVLSLGNCLFYL